MWICLDLGHHRARQVSAANLDIGPGIGRANTLGDGADAVLLRELAAFGKLDRDAGRLKQARGRLGDQLQRPRGIPRCVGDRAEDFGACLLLHPRGFQLLFQPRRLRPEGRFLLAGIGLGRFRLAQAGLAGFGHAGFARPQPVAIGRRATLSRFSLGLGHLSCPWRKYPIRARAQMSVS